MKIRTIALLGLGGLAAGCQSTYEPVRFISGQVVGEARYPKDPDFPYAFTLECVDKSDRFFHNGYIDSALMPIAVPRTISASVDSLVNVGDYIVIRSDGIKRDQNQNVLVGTKYIGATVKSFRLQQVKPRGIPDFYVGPPLR